MISPEAIPQFTGNLEQLEKDYGGLKTVAGNIRTTGSDVHSQFQGLSAYYTAPDAEQLFASTKPVADRADGFADDLEKVSSALSSYSTEVRPLVHKLEQLKLDATSFVGSVKDDDDWEYDEDKVEEHNQIRDDVTATVAAFWAAERTCHNAITGLFGGTQMVAGDGSDRADQYGFSADDMKNAKLPWGDPVEEKHHVWEVGHWVKSFFWDGLIVDGVWGTIKGLGTLVGFGGWDAMGQAWKGLAQLATGLTISQIPGFNALFWSLPDDKLPSWLRDSRTAMKETGKALVAWDEWGRNPGRAAGAVTFNVVTTVFTGGTGGAVAGAGKAGAVAKVLSVVGKAGRVIDPMTYIAKGAGAGLSKIGDITKGLKGIGNIEIPRLPDGSVQLPDGRLLEPNGNLISPNGAIDTTPVHYETNTPTVPHGTTPTLPDHWTVQGGQQPVSAGVHTGTDAAAHTVDNAGHYNAPTPTIAASHTPGGAFDTTPSPTSYAQTPSGASYGHAPSPSGYDFGPNPSAYDQTPTSTPHPGGHDGPGTGGHGTPDTPLGTGHDVPGAGHADDASHGDDGAGHADDAAHTGDYVDVGDAAAHHGTDGPVAPGPQGADVPGSGAGEPFEFKPHMSADDFENLATDAERHAVATAELERGTNPYPSTSDAAGKAYGDAYWNDFLDNLDPKAKGALERYSSFYYQHINGQLRNTAVPLERPVQDLVDNMDRVMGSRAVPEDIMVVRGTAYDHILDDVDTLFDLEGRTVKDEGFTSTSLGKNAAFDYKPMIMHMRVPKGTPALWIDHISVNKGERELLLARGTDVKVTRVFQDTAGKWHLYGEVLPRLP